MEIIKLEYSAALIKRAVKSYWLKQIGPVFIAITAALFLYSAYRLLNGDRSQFVGFLATVAILAIIIATASYFIHLKRALIKLQRMKKPEATLDVTESSFRVVSDVGESAFEWSVIKQVWQFDEMWLLFFSASEFMTLPTKNITEEHKTFMLHKLKESGAKIA